MTSCCLIILSLIFPLPCIGVQASSSFNEELSLMKIVSKNNVFQAEKTPEDMKHQLHPASDHVERTEIGETTNLRSFKGQSLLHHRYSLRNVHGILNIIGWGTLLPIGVITARYFRKFPMQSDEWYPLHVLCQSSGYFLGAIGWGIGLWLGNISKHYTLKTHRILGILVFTFATIQMLIGLLQWRREDECRKCWKICHHVMGYTVIALSIANIFQGIIHQTHPEKWKLVYVGILAVLAFLAVALEVLRWRIKSRIKQQMEISPDFG